MATAGNTGYHDAIPWPMTVAIGLAILAQASLLLGLMSWLRAPIVAALAIGLNLAAAGAWRRAAADAVRALARMRRGDIATCAAVALLGCPPFLLALYPPLGFDETLYHLPCTRVRGERRHAVSAAAAAGEGIAGRALGADRDGRGVEDVPAALRRRILLGAAGHDRLPVHRLQVDLEADLLQRLLADRRKLVRGEQVGRVHHHDRRAVVAALLQELARLLEIGFDQQVAVALLVGRAAHQRRVADPVDLGVAHLGAQEILLGDRIHRRLPGLEVVERRVEVVEAHDDLAALRVPAVELDVLVGLQQGKRSGTGSSIRSISPWTRALTAVLGSEIASHSRRSIFTTLPPASIEGGSARGLYLVFLT